MKSFEEIIGNAQKLMLDEDFNRKVNAKAASMNKKGAGGTPVDLARMEREVFGYTSLPSQVNETTQPANPQYQQPAYYQQPAAPTNAPRIDYRGVADKKMQERIAANGQSAIDRLPAALKESMKKTPLMSGDSWPIDENGQVKQAKQTAQKVNESYIPAPPQTIVGATSAIDYGVIKAIVNECLRENSKALLNESISAFHIGEGNVIQFMDKKGNIFEGTLKLKKKGKK